MCIHKMKKRKRTVREILDLSVPAVCGIKEREVSVAVSRVPTTITTLKRAGFNIIGTSYGETPRKKIWFIRPGSL